MPTEITKKDDLERELEKKLSSITTHNQEEESAKKAQELKMPFSNLTGVPVDSEALLLIPEDQARSAGLAAIYKNGNSLIVAVIDPNNAETQKVVKNLEDHSYTLKVILTSPEALAKVWDRYKTAKPAEVFEQGAVEIHQDELQKIQEKIQNIDDLKNQINATSTTALLEIFLAGALKIQASDIHFEPEDTNVRLRYRLDGLLQDVTEIDSVHYEKLVNRIKILSKLKLNVHKAPQDGRFTIREQDIDIEVRVSVLPSEYGETIVMRLLDPRTIKADLKDLGMRPDILEQVKKQLDKPNGALLNTGPTGSGKTTSLYAFINYLNAEDTKIITVEDPIEYHIKGISQTQVDPERGYTFAGGLRAIVRQDPDVILIGEIRDLETADIALHAALTGHLVLSTIHTNDAAGTIPRLVDIGIKPETIAPSISMAMGQRLVRKLCETCKIEGHLEEVDAKRIAEEMKGLKERFKLPEIDDKLKVYFPGKCDDCNQLGYKGRVGVYEVFTISRDMEKLIISHPAQTDISDLAIKEGMVTMLQDGYLKMIEGMTSLDELRRILG